MPRRKPKGWRGNSRGHKLAALKGWRKRESKQWIIKKKGAGWCAHKTGSVGIGDIGYYQFPSQAKVALIRQLARLQRNQRRIR